jgi:hypothetical protein
MVQGLYKAIKNKGLFDNKGEKEIPSSPGSRGSGREKGFFAQARRKPISPRGYPF